MPLWITESGWPVGWFGIESETEQKDLLKKAVDFARANEGPLKLSAYIWYDIRDNGSGSWSNNCGLRTATGGYRESWRGFQEENDHPVWPTGPSATTGGTSSGEIGTTEATVNGTVDPNGAATTYHVEFGPTPEYGSSSGSFNVGPEGPPQAVHAVLQGLTPRTTYHYRLVATNSHGTSRGSDRTFKAASPTVAFQSQLGELWATPIPDETTNLHFGMGTEPSRASIAELAGGGYQVAFRAYGNDLFTYSSFSGPANLHQPMTAGSAPSIAAIPGGGYLIAFQSAEGQLNVYNSLSGETTNLHQGMGFSASDPSIAVLSDGSWVIAFRAYGNVLEAYSSKSGGIAIGTPMKAGASPSIAAEAGAKYQIAFQAASGELQDYAPGVGSIGLGLSMGSEPSTPSMTELSGGGMQIAFRSDEGELWTYSSFSGAQNLHLGMGSTATAPSIAAIPGGGYEIAFKATGDELWAYNSFTGAYNTDLAMMPGSSPSISTR